MPATTTMEYVADQARIAFGLTWYETCVLLAPGAILALTMNVVTGSLEKSAYRAFGPRLYLILFGWLGTAIHELGHLVMCLMFLHRVRHVKLFTLNPRASELGHVRHGFNVANPYQAIGNLFIGIGPILLGALTIYYVANVTVGSSSYAGFTGLAIAAHDFASFDGWAALAGGTYAATSRFVAKIAAPARAGDWRVYVFIYVSLSVGSAVRLSRSDLRGAGWGLMYLLTLMFLVNVVALRLGLSATDVARQLPRYYQAFYPVMVFAIAVNALFAVAMLPISMAARFLRRG